MQKCTVVIVLFLALLTTTGGSLPAQVTGSKEVLNWYFGRGAGISFASGMPQRTADGAMHALEGCATISDPANGRLLFYTDGDSVWNAEHNLMPNGIDLMGGVSSARSALILRQPGSAHIYYVFSTSDAQRRLYDPGNMGWFLSLVDMRLDGGRGDVLAGQRTIRLMRETMEGQAATLDCAGRNYWVIAYNWQHMRFEAHHLSDSGLSYRPVYSEAELSIDLDSPEYPICTIEIAPDGNKLAVVTLGSVELFSFDSRTGHVSNRLVLADEGGVYYGASFSPNNSKLYVAHGSVFGGRSILQYDLSNPDPSSIISSVTVVATAPFTQTAFGSSQLGPDGRLYIARVDGTRLSVINQPDNKGFACDYQNNGPVLGGREATFGLPNFVDAGFNTGTPPSCSPMVDFTISDTLICAGQTINFEDISRNEPTRWHWLLPGATPEEARTQSARLIRYDSAGMYTITLIVGNEFGSDTMSKTVRVLPAPDIDAGPDIRMCPGGLDSMQVQGPPGLYRWRPVHGLSDPFAQNPLVAPEKSTTYIVSYVAENGCSDEDTVRVTVFAAADVKAGQSITMCPGAVARLRGYGADRYEWNPPDFLDDPMSYNPIIRPGVSDTVLVYYLRGSTYDGCTGYDSVEVHILPHAQADAGPDIAFCRGESGQLQAGPAESYSWYPPDDLDRSDIADPRVHALRSRWYELTIRNAQGCEARDSVLVTVHPNPTIRRAADAQICPGAGVRIGMEDNPNYAYTWFPADGLDDPQVPRPLARPAESMVYYLEVSNSAGCMAYDTVEVRVHDSLSVDAGSPVRMCSGTAIQLQAVLIPGASYEWEPAEGLSDPHIHNPVASPARTTLYRLRVSSSEGCSGQDSVLVQVQEPPRAAAGADREVCAGDTVHLHSESAEGARHVWRMESGETIAEGRDIVVNPGRTQRYFLLVEDEFGCWSADSVLVEVRAEHELELSIPVVEADLLPGDTAAMAVMLHSPGAAELAAAQVDSVWMLIRYESGTLLPLPQRLENGSAAADWTFRLIDNPQRNELILSGSGSPLAVAGELCRLAFGVYLSDADTLFTPLGFDAAASGLRAECAVLHTSDGGFSLDEFCLRNLRHVTLSRTTYNLGVAVPNPVEHTATIPYSVGLEGHTSIRVFDALGRVVAIPVDSRLAAGSYRFELSGLSPGLYYYIMHSGPFRAVQSVVVGR